MTNVISTVLIVLAVSYLMRYLAQQSKRPAQVENEGNKVLRMPMIYEVIAWVGLAFSAFLAIIGILFNSHSTVDKFGWLSIFGFFLILGVPLILVRRNTKLVFNDDGVTYTNSFLKNETISWKEIKTVSFKHKTLTLRGDNKKIGVSYSMIGFQNFIDFIKTKLSSSVFETALKELEKFSTSVGTGRQ